jgi:hypothetical protein
VPTNYYLKREGLVLLGVLSAHAFASLEITVPFAGIRDLLAKDGVLGALAAPASKQPINGN